jgi:predicted DNA-binding transcriptional regulator YafY
MADKARQRSQSVTAGRVARLYRFIALLKRGPAGRATLLRRLSLNQRGFYRDMELLRAAGIHVEACDGRYRLIPNFQAAVDRLPFPDPRLSLGEAQRLCRGNTAAHRTLRAQVHRITRNRP